MHNWNLEGLNLKAKISAIQPNLKSAGPGIFTEIFFYGCTKGCPGCINQWVQEEGHYNELTIGEILAEVVSFDNFNIAIGGGEPFEQENALAELVFWLRPWVVEHRGSILLYTGKEFDKFVKYNQFFFRYIDYMVVGPYVEAQRYEKVEDSFVGSRNQDVIAFRDGRVVGRLVLDAKGRIAPPRGV